MPYTQAFGILRQKKRTVSVLRQIVGARSAFFVTHFMSRSLIKYNVQFAGFTWRTSVMITRSFAVT